MVIYGEYESFGPLQKYLEENAFKKSLPPLSLKESLPIPKVNEEQIAEIEKNCLAVSRTTRMLPWYRTT